MRGIGREFLRRSRIFAIRLVVQVDQAFSNFLDGGYKTGIIALEDVEAEESGLCAGTEGTVDFEIAELEGEASAVVVEWGGGPYEYWKSLIAVAVC